jgi:DNA replication protein DnaC
MKRTFNSKSFDELTDFGVDQKKLNIERAFSESRIPARHLGKKDFTCEAWWEYKNRIKLWSGSIYILCGPRGTGKTQLAVEKIWDACQELKKCLYAKITTLFLEIKSTYSKASTETEKDVLEKYLAPSLLVIDEVNERADTDWENRVFTHIVSDRHDNLKDTILITNERPEALQEIISPTILSRSQEVGGILRFDGKIDNFRR